jgi:hypothetical protein
MIAGLQLLAHMAAPAVLTVAGAPASVGTGIQPGPVCLASTVQPGHSYALPPVWVSDKGSGGENITLWVQTPTPGTNPLPGIRVPSSWVSFTYPHGWWGLTGGSSVGTTPGVGKFVPATLNVPASAAPGSYASWLMDGLAGNSPADGTPVSASFGSDGITWLQFTVAKPGSPARRAVCITPGVKQAKPAAPAPPAAGAAPSALPATPFRYTGKELAGGVGAVVVVVALYRRRRHA